MPGVADLAASDTLFSSEVCAHSTSSQPESSAVGTSSPSPRQQYITFNGGTKVVGTDIQPGTYRTRRSQPGCYFARLRGFSGALEDIISNELSNFPLSSRSCRPTRAFGLTTAIRGRATFLRSQVAKCRSAMGTSLWVPTRRPAP